MLRANRGGLIVDVGARGFLPAALIETVSVEAEQLEDYVGQQIIERHVPSKNLVVSRRAALENG